MKVVFTILLLLVIPLIAIAESPLSDYNSEGPHKYLPPQFTYFKIYVDGKQYLCESYEKQNDGSLIMKNVFVEGASKIKAELVVVPFAKIDSIQKMSGESKEKVTRDACCGCFIQTITN